MATEARSSIGALSDHRYFSKLLKVTVKYFVKNSPVAGADVRAIGAVSESVADVCTSAQLDADCWAFDFVSPARIEMGTVAASPSDVLSPTILMLSSSDSLSASRFDFLSARILLMPEPYLSEEIA
jgi:hypothetical protein